MQLIEAAKITEKDRLKLNRDYSDDKKNSFEAAYGYVKSKSDELNINKEEFI